MPKGKKTCPECDTLIGARNKQCPECNYEFFPKISRQKQINEKPETFPKKIPLKRFKTKVKKYTGNPISVEDICSVLAPMKHSVRGNIFVCLSSVVVRHTFEPELKFNALYCKIEMDTATGDLSIFKGTMEQQKPDIVYKNMIQIGSLV
ncbi:MAG: hypothetical protein ACOC5T_05595 [Elusimicrobiota bacterium]